MLTLLNGICSTLNLRTLVNLIYLNAWTGGKILGFLKIFFAEAQHLEQAEWGRIHTSPEGCGAGNWRGGQPWKIKVRVCSLY